MYFLTKELYFPPIEMASPEGIVAVGGDLSQSDYFWLINQEYFHGLRR